MKKLVSLLVALMMIFVLFAGCGSTSKPDTDEEDNDQEETESVETVDDEDILTDDTNYNTGSPIAGSYAAFVEAKTAVYSRLSDGLSSNPDTIMASLSMAGALVIDLYMFPVAFFGLGEEAAAAGLAYFNAEGVQYSENGNSYTITYTDSEGSVQALTGTFDIAADSLICTGSEDGVENFYSEYRKTPYGYVAQYYFIDDEDSAYLYLVTVNGEDGSFGMSTVTARPAALTGSEPADFPSTCTEWYAISGSTITGVTPDGTAINFEYVPTETPAA
jgi:hypothetical protein